MNRPRVSLFVILFSLALLCFGGLSASAQDAASKIAFLSDRDGNQEIYVMNADGSEQTNLTNNDVIDAEVVWSPDGQSIVFSRDVGDDTWNIFTQAVDGSEARQVSDGGADGAPKWSPNGTQIAFETSPVLAPHVAVVNADGSPAFALIDTEGDNGNYSARPNWSPDGTRVAFAASRGAAYDIHVINADGSGEQALTSAPDNETRPIWSPDGQKIAYMARANADEDYEIFVINADGSGAIQLTDNDAYDGDVAWSLDSQRIAFDSLRDGNVEIYVIGADGTNPINLTQNSGSDSVPVWSPDGTQIAFTSDRDGNSEIYVMNADGSSPINLTNNPANDYNPAWQPSGAAITAAPQSAEAAVETVADDSAEAPAETPATSVAPAVVYPISADNAGDLIPVATIGSADTFISNASIAFSGNTQYLAYVNIGGSSALGVWDVFAGQDTGLALGTASGIQWLGFSGTDLTMLAQSSTALYRWSLPSGERYPYHSLSGFPARTETSLSPDGTLAGTRTSDGSFIVGSTVTGESLLTLPIDQNYDQSAFSPDNTLLALADPNGAVQLWDLATGEIRHTLPSNGGYNLAFTADSSVVALCGANDGIEMWNAATGETLPGLPSASCSQMVFSPDGSLLATSNFLDVSIWDIASAQRVGTYPGRTVAFSPNGQYLAAVRNDQTQLSIWSAPDTGSATAPVPTEAPTETAAEAPADTSAVSCSLTANSNANLRTGPGTMFDRAGTVSSGETAQADGQSQPGDGFTWYRLTTGAWVRADLVTAAAECAGLAAVSP